MARRKYKETFNYNCSITDEKFAVTKKAPNPDELISVKAYYELNPEKDDRPEAIKKKFSEIETETETDSETETETAKE